MEERSRPSVFQVMVRLWRALRGWGVAEYAAKAGVDPKTVYRLEAGEVLPQAKTREKLAAGVDLSTFFVDTCLAPALEAARAGSEPFDGEAFKDLEAAGAELDSGLSGTGRSAIGLFAREIEEEDREPWERRSPPCEADRLQAADASERLADCNAKQRRFLVETCSEFHNWAVAERLCHASEEAASGTADEALELANLACRVVELARCEEPWRSRLRGYALAYLANARRVGNDLQGAKEDFARALELWQAGAAAGPGLLAEWRLLDLEASLRRANRQFGDALDLHRRSLAAAPPEAHGRILLKKAFTLQQQGETEQAVKTLRKAAPLVDGQSEPHRRYSWRMNLAASLCDLERYGEAEALLPELKELSAALRKKLDQVRVVWLSGRIAAGLGRTAEAQEAFEQVRRDFTDRKMAYDCALASLDLAKLLLEQGRTAEVRALAEEMLWLFKAQGIQREALAALRMFCAAAKRQAATVELARRAGEALGKA